MLLGLVSVCQDQSSFQVTVKGDAGQELPYPPQHLRTRVMLSVIRIQQAVNRNSRLVPGGSTIARMKWRRQRTLLLIFSRIR